VLLERLDVLLLHQTTLTIIDRHLRARVLAHQVLIKQELICVQAFLIGLRLAT